MKHNWSLPFRILICLAVAMPLGLATPVSAAPLRVCSSGCAYTTLQAAVDAAASGDVIQIASGTYTGVTTVNEVTQLAYITKSLTLAGGYSADFSTRDVTNNPTILDAQAGGRVLYINGSDATNGSIDVTLDGIEIKGGHWGITGYVAYNDIHGLTDSWWQDPAGGGVYARHANLILTGVNLHDNHTFNGIGSGLFQQYGSLSMLSSTVKGNTGTGGYYGSGAAGGGLFLLQVNATISYSTISTNSAGYSDSVGQGSDAYGGGIFLNHSSGYIDHNTIDGNVASQHTSGWGGGIASEMSSVTLIANTISNNVAAQVYYYYSQQGGGAYLETYGIGTLEIIGNTFENNSNSGLYAGGAMTVNGNTFSGNSMPSNAGSAAGGVSLGGTGVFKDNVVSGNSGAHAGGALFSGSLLVSGNTFENNTTTADGGGLVADGTVTLLRNTIQNNTAAGCGGGIATKSLALEDGDLILNNSALTGGGLCIRTNPSTASYQNLVILNNQASANGSGVYIDRGKTSGVLSLRNLTIGSNTGGDGAGVTFNSGLATFTNTILYNQAVGVQTIGGIPTFIKTLRYQVTTPTVGSVSDNFAIEGDPAFAADGYHLTESSAAIDEGSGTPVANDIDGDARPQGQTPDIGADETFFTRELPQGVNATQLNGTPHWVMQWDSASGGTSWLLQQDSLIRYSYGGASTDPSLTSVSIQENLPSVLQPAALGTSRAMNYSQNGSVLTWTSSQPLLPGDSGWVSILGQSKNAAAGDTLSGAGSFEYAVSGGETKTIDFPYTSQVPVKPLLPPKLTSPLTGEMCLDENGELEASGLTYAGMLAHLYENGVEVGTATADASGIFNLKWKSALTNSNSISLYATVCDPSAPGNCSAPSGSVRLDAPLAYWCPQRSYWEGNVGSTQYLFHFVNDQGRYATNDFQLPGIYGFSGTQIHLYACCNMESSPFIVRADGVEYTTPSSHDGRMWTYNIGSAHDVMIKSQCSVGEGRSSHGTILIDPDGFVFDASRGGQYDTLTGVFAPAKALSGITVTAYEYIPEWDTWIEWPASLYDNQVNPQVTGANGYFAFFTPPGKYYLQATAANGFQAWRSPVIEVISQIVHQNIPLTAWSSRQVTQVTLTPAGPSPAVVTISAGATVEWISSPGSVPNLTTLIRLAKNPVTRILSSLDPLTDVLGFDGGRLAPGETFRRQFTQAGTYTYTDGYGNTGTVIVTGSASSPYTYLPLIRR